MARQYRVLTAECRKDIEDFVRESMKSFDASHDFFHIQRVRNLALRIAREEGFTDLLIVELAALLHDVNDHKYVQHQKDQQSNTAKMMGILQKHKITAVDIEEMQLVIDNMSYTKERKRENDPKYKQLFSKHPALAIVQDADRLDAIGAVGVARTFCFSGQKDRALFDMTPMACINENDDAASEKKESKVDVEKQCEEWVKHGDGENETTIEHFYDKLLLLKDMMKTKTGRKLAEQRHAAMQNFLKHFFLEWHQCEE